MKLLRPLLLSILLTLGLSSYAENFMSTEPADRLFNIGVRLGINSSNRTFGKDYFNEWNVNSWGTGMDVGAILDLNLRDFFSLQPGFFYESRSGNYAYSQTYYKLGDPDKYSQMGHFRTYSFVVPVMASFRFNLTDNLRWIAEAGPYAQFQLHSTDNDKIVVIDPQKSPSSLVSTSVAKTQFFDFGLKIGTGFSLFKKYSLYIHYMAGGKKVWKSPHAGGHNKAWVFTLGYDL